MTEAEWLASKDSQKMFQVFGGVYGKMRLDHRLRRYAVECCRRVRHLITDEVFLSAADAGEAFADDPRNERNTISIMARASIEGWRHRRRCEATADPRQLHAASAAIATCGPTDWQAAFNTMREAAQALNQEDGDACDPTELQYHADMLRCIFGPVLFRQKRINTVWPDWNCSTIPSLAQKIYEGRAFDLLPLLADALEDAGCTDGEVLAHCRSPGPHVRGCWVVDLTLAKG